MMPCEHCGAAHSRADLRIVEGTSLCPTCTGEVLREEPDFKIPFGGEHAFIREPLIGMLVKVGLQVYPGRSPEERCVPRWSAHVASAALSAVWFLHEGEVQQAVQKVADDVELQRVLAGGRAMGASGLDLFTLIQEWNGKDG